MKLLAQFASVIVLFSTLVGCATSGEHYEVRLAPPDTFNPTFMKYKELPGEKVMAIAVDPNGQWAFGFDHSQDSLETASTNAIAKCDRAREDYQVFSKSKIFAVNNDIIYYDDF